MFGSRVRGDQQVKDKHGEIQRRVQNFLWRQRFHLLLTSMHHLTHGRLEQGKLELVQDLPQRRLEGTKVKGHGRYRRILQVGKYQRLFRMQLKKVRSGSGKGSGRFKFIGCRCAEGHQKGNAEIIIQSLPDVEEHLCDQGFVIFDLFFCQSDQQYKVIPVQKTGVAGEIPPAQFLAHGKDAAV